MGSNDTTTTKNSARRGGQSGRKGCVRSGSAGWLGTGCWWVGNGQRRSQRARALARTIQPDIWMAAVWCRQRASPPCACVAVRGRPTETESPRRDGDESPRRRRIAATERRRRTGGFWGDRPPAVDGWIDMQLGPPPGPALIGRQKGSGLGRSSRRPLGAPVRQMANSATARRTADGERAADAAEFAVSGSLLPTRAPPPPPPPPPPPSPQPPLPPCLQPLHCARQSPRTSCRGGGASGRLRSRSPSHPAGGDEPAARSPEAGGDSAARAAAILRCHLQPSPVSPGRRSSPSSRPAQPTARRGSTSTPDRAEGLVGECAAARARLLGRRSRPPPAPPDG